jgi:predicted MFS family arabinose efflux permease
MNYKKACPASYGRLVFILGLAGFISAADNWFVSPVLPAIAKSFGASISQTGAILTAYLIPYGVMQPIYGFFSDRYGKSKTLKAIVYGLAIGTLGCAFSSSLPMLCIFRIITGFFAAGIITISLAFIGDTVPAVYRPVYVGRFMGIVFLGQGISAGLGGVFAKYLSWRVAFAFFFMVAIVVEVLLRELPDNVSASNQLSFIRELRYVLMSPKGKKMFPLAFAAGFLLLGIYSYLGSFLNKALGLNYLQGGLIIMFYGLSCLLAGTLVGKSGQKIGRPATILLGGFFGLCTALLLVFLPFWQTGILATISLGFGYIFIQSTLATAAFDVSTQNTGLSSGLIGLCLFGGGGIGTAFGSSVLAKAGYKDLWLLFLAGIVLFNFLLIPFCFHYKPKLSKNIRVLLMISLKRLKALPLARFAGHRDKV